MKISLDEAYKQATPGPFMIIDGCVTRPAADADLLIHCFANFAEAVALLRRAAYSTSCSCSQVGMCGHERSCITRKIESAVQRFETLEIP